jgi:hypothetical protein
MVTGETEWKGPNGNGAANMNAVQRLNGGGLEGFDMKVCPRYQCKCDFNGDWSWA